MNDPLLNAATAIMRQHPTMDVREAWRLALADNPDAYQHSTPDGSVGGAGGRAAASGPSTSPAPDGPLAPGVRHFRELAPWERREELRRMGRDAGPVRADRTYVHKLGGPSVPGAGLFEVVP